MSTSFSTRRCSQFSLEEIKGATIQFDRSKIIGQGGEAKVYYAEICINSNKTPVAVKHLKNHSEEFEREIQTLSNIQHPSLVSLIGYCDESGHKILVYEYMEKGCLSDYLKKKSDISLSWLQRLKISLGAARGLQHLHTETDEFPKGIIHRDVKPGNILVGENWVGKISDFGMFKLSHDGQDKSLMTTNLRGTSGYFAPEYINYGRITRKIDVYSFGVVLFQVLCRKMPWDREDESYFFDEKEDLGIWAQQNVDAQIRGEMSENSVKIFTDIIGRSLQAKPGRRPTMDGVVLDLEKALESQNLVIESFGPWGGNGGRMYDFMGQGEISHIHIKYDIGIHSIMFTSQNENGHLKSSRRIGGRKQTFEAQIVLDTKNEKLVGISGTVGVYLDIMVVTSLKFYTSTNRSFGPFGLETGTPFSHMAVEGSIIGFYGCDGFLIDSIGIRVQVNKSF